MSKKSSMQDVSALVDERRQYESWLAALESKRESTAPHVYERVEADYRGRLERVKEQLASHREELEEELTGLRSRLALADAEIKLRSDERSEMELRAAVGELSEGDAKKALRAVDESLQKLAEERSEIDSAMNRITEIIDGTSASPAVAAPAVAAPAVATAPVAAPSAVSPVASPESAAPAPVKAAAAQEAAPAPKAESGTFDELSFLNSVVEGAAPKLEQKERPAKPSRGDAKQKKSEKGSESVVETKPAVEPAAAKPAQPSVPSEPVAPPAPPAQKRVSGIIRDEPASVSLLADLENKEESEEGDQPLAANVPANTPIRLRSSGQMEPSKTLKCIECGTMNYPTEWYCERCGAELAAL